MLAMNLKTQTDYALRVLIYLAYKDSQTPVEEIANAYGISKDHLVKVVQLLVRHGYLVSRSGRNGGMKLARDPAAMNVGTIVSEIEGRNGVLPCVTDLNYCNLEPGCALRSALIKAEDAFYETLNKLTVGDLVRANVAKGSGGIYNLTVNRRAATPVKATEMRFNE